MKRQGLFALGLGIGVAMGVALHNVAIGTALGAGIGVALAGSQTCIRTRKEKTISNNTDPALGRNSRQA